MSLDVAKNSSILPSTVNESMPEFRAKCHSLNSVISCTLHRIQPNADTRAKQEEAWADLIVAYCKHFKKEVRIDDQKYEFTELPKLCFAAYLYNLM